MMFCGGSVFWCDHDSSMPPAAEQCYLLSFAAFFTVSCAFLLAMSAQTVFDEHVVSGLSRSIEARVTH